MRRERASRLISCLKRGQFSIFFSIKEPTNIREVEVIVALRIGAQSGVVLERGQVDGRTCTSTE